MSMTHDPRLREALILLKHYEAERLVLLAERARDRQTIDALERQIFGLEAHIASMKSANRRRPRRQVGVTT